MNKHTLIAVALLSSAAASHALELPEQLSDHTVLQQQSDVKLWGWAKPGATVAVTPSWSKKAVSVKADEAGRWTAYVATPAASYTPYSITFAEGKEKATIDDVLVGEVWVASGQSNMEMPMRGFDSQPVEGSAEAIARSGALRDKVRMVHIALDDKWEPQERAKGSWKVASPANTAEFGAQAFYFARELNSIIDVPVGIVHVAYGGTQVEGWMPVDLLESLGVDVEERIRLEKEGAPLPWPAYRYGTKYTTMMNPVIGYTIKGFIWNQGESNAGNPDIYARYLAAMVERWRKDWGDKENKLSFYQTENPGFGWFAPDALGGALVREQQNMAVDMIPNSGITGTNDLVHPFEVDIIHGSIKREIGERMAWQVAEKDYGIAGMPWRAPKYLSMSKNDEGTTLVKITDVGFGLNPMVGKIEGFEVAGEDGVFYPANAKIVVVYGKYDNTQEVAVSSPEVPDIKNVRYCFKNFAIGNVRNSNGMPLTPFRTDK